MLIPKWLLGLLFFVAIGSTIGLLVLLTERQGTFSATPTIAPSNTVIVSPSATPALTQAEPSASGSAMLSTAEWKTYKSTALSVSFDYPSTWSIQASSSGELVVRDIPESSASSKEQVRIQISRVKKASTTSKLDAFVQKRQEEYTSSFKSSTIISNSTRKIHNFDALVRVYDTGSTPFDEIAFATKNYFYTIVITPHGSPLQVMVDELLKSFEVL